MIWDYFPKRDPSHLREGSYPKKYEKGTVGLHHVRVKSYFLVYPWTFILVKTGVIISLTKVGVVLRDLVGYRPCCQAKA